MSTPASIDPQMRRVALLVAACFFMETLDATIVVTAIPKISAALDEPAGQVALIITAYLLTLAVLVPLSSWMTGRFGPRRVFLAAIVIFTAASLGCALSPTLAWLIGMRILQGAGGAMMVPVGRTVVFAQAPKAQIMRLMSYTVWPGLVAPVIAPLAGGVITTYAGWEWLFLINVPLGVAALIAARRLIHGGPTPGMPPLDRLGLALTGSGLAALTYAAHLLSEPRPTWRTAGALALTAAVLLGAAVRHLLRTPAPLLNIRTLQVPTFAIAMSGSALFWVVVGAIPFLLPLLFQTVFGWSAIRSGAVVLFLFAGNVGIKPATTWLYNRFGFRRTLMATTAAVGVTALGMALTAPGTPVAVIIGVVLSSGIARSVGLTGYSTLAMSDIAPGQMRDANAMMATGQQLFAGLGVAVATLALRAGGPLGDLLPGAPDAETAFSVAFVLLAVAAFAACANTLRLEPAAGAALMDRRRAA